MNPEEQKNGGVARSRWRIPTFFLAAAVGLGIAWYLFGYAEKTPDKATAPQGEETEENPEQTAGMVDEAVDLAIRTISLSQGEGGFELWRLKAEWANLRRRDDSIIVEKPRLTYNMREEGKVLFVTSRTGDINQKEQILRFIDDVSATQESKHITGPLLVYNGKEKTMTFPQGSHFEDTGVFGSADTLVWHIERQFVEGEGNIKVLLEGRREAASPNNFSTQKAPASSKETP